MSEIMGSNTKLAFFKDMVGSIGKDPAREKARSLRDSMATKARNGNVLDKGMNWLLRPAVDAVGGVMVGNQEKARGNTGAAMRSYGGAAANTGSFLLNAATPVFVGGIAQIGLRGVRGVISLGGRFAARRAVAAGKAPIAEGFKRVSAGRFSGVGSPSFWGKRYIAKKKVTAGQSIRRSVGFGAGSMATVATGSNLSTFNPEAVQGPGKWKSQVSAGPQGILHKGTFSNLNPYLKK